MDKYVIVYKEHGKPKHYIGLGTHMVDGKRYFNTTESKVEAKKYQRKPIAENTMRKVIKYQKIMKLGSEYCVELYDVDESLVHRHDINTAKALSEMLPEVLHKDLQENERICTYCSGLGMIAVKNQYGITGDKSEAAKGRHFPYQHQSLTFCPVCFNGVQKLCPHCGSPYKKGYSRCDCEGAKAERQIKHNKVIADRIDKAEQVNHEDVDTIYYSADYDRFFYDIDEFWSERRWQQEDVEGGPTVLWVCKKTELSLDAYNVLANACDDLHEDAFDNCDVDGLQKILDEYSKEQTGTTSYFPAYDQYVIVPTA